MEGRHWGDLIFDVLGRESKMTIAELITDAEQLVKTARERYTQGHTDAAKHSMLNLAAKILSTLPGPAEEKTPSPARSQW